MPTVRITGSQIVYYEKEITLDQEEYNDLMSLYHDESTSNVMQWLADGDLGFCDDDWRAEEPVEDLNISRKA